MILGLSYISPAVLSVIIDRTSHRIEIVDTSSGPKFANLLKVLEEDKKDKRVLTLLIEKVTTAVALAQILPAGTKFKAIIFDTPDSLTFTGVNVLDAKLANGTTWHVIELKPDTFNNALNGLATVETTDLGALKEKRFKPARAQAESKDAPPEVISEVSDPDAETPLDEAEVPPDDVPDPDEVDAAPAAPAAQDDVVTIAPVDSKSQFIALASKIKKDEIKLAFCMYVVGMLKEEDAKKALTKEQFNYGNTKEANSIWIAFYNFVKNEMDISDAAKLTGCEEAVINYIADIVDVSNPVFLSIPPETKSAPAPAPEPRRPVVGRQRQQTPEATTPAPAKPASPSEVLTPAPTGAPKTFVEAINYAFHGVTAPEVKAALELATANYVTTTSGTKATFNGAVKAAAKAGADDKHLKKLDKLANGEYGNWAWSAYGDMVVYNTGVTEAAKNASVDADDLALFVGLCPVAAADKAKYEGNLPKWVTKVRKSA